MPLLTPRTRTDRSREDPSCQEGHPDLLRASSMLRLCWHRRTTAKPRSRDGQTGADATRSPKQSAVRNWLENSKSR
jgi:hypothetical protein